MLPLKSIGECASDCISNARLKKTAHDSKRRGSIFLNCLGANTFCCAVCMADMYLIVDSLMMIMGLRKNRCSVA